MQKGKSEITCLHKGIIIYESTTKKKTIMNAITLPCNLDIVHLFGCIIAGKCIDKLIKFTKELYALSFVDLLKKSGKVNNDRNLQYLAVEIYKALHTPPSCLMSEIFRTKTSNYNFRNNAVLVKNHSTTTSYGVKCISHLASTIWDLIPKEIRDCDSINLFKTKIKTCTPQICPYYNCKTYI